MNTRKRNSTQRPIMLIDNMPPCDDEDEEDAYESMDEDELDGENEEIEEFSQQQTSQQSEDIIDPKPSTSSSMKLCCAICKRGHSEKFILFKWPSDKKTRLSWAVALDIMESTLGEDALICAFHFPSSHFSFVDGRVYWEKTAFPRYTSQRPADEPPFPWENTRNASKYKINAQQQQPPEPIAVRQHHKPVPDHRNYSISYRRSFYKNKGRKAHAVAIVNKLDANIYHEFSYNRTSHVDGTKYYTCLGCRKAKTETHVKDVVRTIHIDGTVILSKADPFYGHHYACLPYTNEPDLKSYRPSVPQPMHMGMSVLYGPSDELIYVDEDGNQTETVWATDSDGLMNIEHVPFYGEGPMTEPDIKPLSSDVVTVEQGLLTPPIRKTKRGRKSRKSPSRSIPKCHLCFLVLPSTAQLIQHLQIHMDRAPSCLQCPDRISPDVRRTSLCSKCQRGPKM